MVRRCAAILVLLLLALAGSAVTGVTAATAAAVPARSPSVITTTGSAAVALTFDDGPSPYTARMLDLLDRYHVKATFCLIGRQVHAYAAVVRRMVADGMTLCNHTWDHDERLRSRGDARIRDELLRTNQAIQAVVPGARIAYFRNPGGAFGPNTVRIASSMGMKPLMWSVDPRDWANPGTRAIIANVLGHTHRGSIVLSHDGGGVRTPTLAAYQTIIPNLRGRFHLIALP
ncbi:MAG TPA: polysaccharide deacetylase family protein [Rugosimonospora sp.]|nr:polysaccharide deacetylase family protein [Rugosimonospora sp.]